MSQAHVRIGGHRAGATRRRPPGDSTMKIQIIKKGAVKAKPSSYCEWFVDDTGGPDKRVQMAYERKGSVAGRLHRSAGLAAGLLLLLTTLACERTAPHSPAATTTLRI